MKSIEWIEKVRKQEGEISYYRTAQLLKMSRQAMSGHKQGRRIYLEERYCLEIAKILKIDPLKVLADQQAEKSKTIEAKNIWLKLAGTAATTAATIALPVLTNITSAAECILC